MNLMLLGKERLDGTEGYLGERLGRHVSPEMAMTASHPYEGG
jgi:hypothetical protein